MDMRMMMRQFSCFLFCFVVWLLTGKPDFDVMHIILAVDSDLYILCVMARYIRNQFDINIRKLIYTHPQPALNFATANTATSILSSI